MAGKRRKVVFKWYDSDGEIRILDAIIPDTQTRQVQRHGLWLDAAFEIAQQMVDAKYLVPPAMIIRFEVITK